MIKQKFLPFILVGSFLLGENSANFAAGHSLADDVKLSTMLDASLVIKANLYFGAEDEDAMPLSKTTLYLLDANLIDILKQANFRPESADGAEHPSEDANYLNATAAAFFSADEESAIVALMIGKSLAEHQIFRKKTDDAGHLRFKPMKTGSYYLFAVSRVEDETFLWNLPINVKPGNNLIELDQHNSEIIDLD